MTFLRLDPQLPILWRSPDAIQIGAEPPRVLIDPVTDHDQRMLAAVRLGVPSEALATVGRCSEETAGAFIERIRPALHALDAGPIDAHVRVRSAQRSEIIGTIRSLGLVGTSPDRRPEVGIVIADHAVPLAAYRDWLREAVPHFAVVFGVDAVTVGPVVLPGTTGCLRCLDLHRTDADPAWPAIASQLIEAPAASAADPIVRTEALCAAARLAWALSRGVLGAEHHSGRRFRRGGAREEIGIEPHPDCGCLLDLQAESAA